MLRTKYLAIAAGLTLAGSIAVAGTAHAASTTGVITSQYLGGYEASYGTVHLNEVRTNVALPSLTGSGVPKDTIAAGVVLQATPGPGVVPTLAVGWVWDDPAATGCSSTQWALEYGAEDEASGQPVPPGGDLTPVLTDGHNICVNSGSEYTEAHWSTSTDEFAIVTSALEVNQTTVALIDPDFGEGYHRSQTFLDAGVGVDTTDGADAALLPTGTKFAFTRDGLTEPAGYNVGGNAGTRVTLDRFPTTEFLGTENGGAESVTDPATLSPSLLPAGSSDFSVTAP